MKINTRPSTLSDIAPIVTNLLDSGLDDIRRLKANAVLHLTSDYLQDECYTFEADTGELVGIFGIGEDGCIWLHMTKVVDQCPIAFIRACKRIVNSLERPLLYNTIDIQNTSLIKFIKHLGFKVINVVAVEPSNNYHVEIVKLWHGWPPSRQVPGS